MSFWIEGARRWGLAAGLGLGLALHGASVRAQGAGQSATAEALFQEARAKLQAGQTQQACPLLEASQRVDPAIGTQLLLAHCYEQLGKTASAWALFREVESLAGDRADRRDLARVRADDLEQRLSKLVVSVDPALPDGVERDALRVERDEAPLPTASLELPVPVDPGEHRIRVSGAGVQVWQQVVFVPAGPSITTLVVRDLLLAPKLTSAQPPAASAAQASPNGERDRNASGRSESEQDWHWGPLITGGAGVLGLAVSGGLAWAAQDAYAASLEHCRQERLCTAAGLELRSQAYERANWATVSGVAGVGLIAAAALWYVLDADEPSESGVPVRLEPAIGQQSLGLSLRGVL